MLSSILGFDQIILFVSEYLTSPIRIKTGSLYIPLGLLLVGNNPATSSDGTRGSVVLAGGQGREA
jgi:hypothetical protein